MTETVSSPDESKKDSSQQPSSPKTKSKASKQANDGNERPKASEKTEKPPTKVVVRRLPPTMTLETFLDQVAPLPPVDYMYFVKADSSLAPNSFARAYLHFIHVSDLLIFTEKFDNYVFVDSKGNEYPAIVEYAPFQRIPKQRSTRKKDPRIGTIENDPYYVEFMEALKAEETQRKSASKTNKQHFFETSTSSAAPKVTSTPLLEFLKARRADKLRTKEDKIAERRKREIERRKAREDSRTSVKQFKTSEGENDTASPPTPVIKPPQPPTDPTTDLAEIQTRYLRCMIGLDKDTSDLEQIAGHGISNERVSKEALDNKRSVKDSGAKDIVSKRREDDRHKTREKDKERKESRDSSKDIKRDVRRDSVKDQVSVHDKDKENQPTTADTKSKETRRGGKSYQEERQRLNERRLAAKGLVPKDGSDKADKPEDIASEDANDKKTAARKDVDSAESRSRNNEKVRNSDLYRQHGSREARKYEKTNKAAREQDQRRSFESRRNIDDRHHDDGRDAKKLTSFDKSTASDVKSEEMHKSNVTKEETRKKSYNQEREQRRAAAADKKNQGRKDILLSNKTDENSSVRVNQETKSDAAVDSRDKLNAEEDKDQYHSHGQSKDEPSQSKSSSKTVRTASESEVSNGRRKENSAKNDEKEKKDPRAERRIRNKDRPSIEIYRPGMGRFSRQRLEREKGLNKGSSTERDSPSPSPSPVPSAVKTTVISENPIE